MHFNAYDVFYSQCSPQHISAAVVALFRLVILLKEYGVTLDAVHQASLHNVLAILTPKILIIIHFQPIFKLPI